METNGRGRVPTEAKVENLLDLWHAERDMIADAEVRRIVIGDARVDTGATLLSLPTSMIEQLGLEKTGSKRVTSSTGGGEANL